jgi:ABC-type oligopeptide transport system substrate-binding subunit
MSSGMRKALSLLALAAGCGLLAASALASARQAPPANTFRWSLPADIDYVDPAHAYYAPTWALMYATAAQLYGYPDAPAPRGSRLVPEVAAGWPTVSRDGRTYTFRLKKTYRLSNGRPVTARSFARAIERAINRRMSAAAQPFIDDVVGAKDVIEGRAPSAAGIRVLDRWTLRIELTRRAPDLLARLAMPFFQAVDRTLPFEVEGVSAPVTSGGPYFIKEWKRNERIVLERNRFYRGPRPRRVRRIVVTINKPVAAIKADIDSGLADSGVIPLEAHAELGRRFGVRRRSPGRYFVNPLPSTVYLAFNHDRPLFKGPTPLGNIRLKQAINYAVDRTAMVRAFGAYGAVATDQLLPPTIRGFRNAAVYPPHPNLARARALASGQIRDGTAVLLCYRRAPWQDICRIVQANLREIGLDVVIQNFPSACGDCPYPDRRGVPIDLIPAQTRSDFHDPAEFVGLWDGTTIRPILNTNVAYFNDRHWNRRIARTRALSGLERFRAFGRLDRDIVRDAAPVAPIATPNDRVYVSARTGCYHHHPVYGWDFPAICLR